MYNASAIMYFKFLISRRQKLLVNYICSSRYNELGFLWEQCDALCTAMKTAGFENAKGISREDQKL